MSLTKTNIEFNKIYINLTKLESYQHYDKLTDSVKNIRTFIESNSQIIPLRFNLRKNFIFYSVNGIEYCTFWSLFKESIKN